MRPLSVRREYTPSFIASAPMNRYAHLGHSRFGARPPWEHARRAAKRWLAPPEPVEPVSQRRPPRVVERARQELYPRIRRRRGVDLDLKPPRVLDRACGAAAPARIGVPPVPDDERLQEEGIACVEPVSQAGRRQKHVVGIERVHEDPQTRRMDGVNGRILTRSGDAEVVARFVEEDAAGPHLPPEDDSPLDLPL